MRLLAHLVALGILLVLDRFGGPLLLKLLTELLQLGLLLVLGQGCNLIRGLGKIRVITDQCQPST